MFLKENKDSEFLDALISYVKGFYKSIPIGLIKAITAEELEKIFYHHSLINLVISRNIIMPVSIFDFIDMVKS